MSLSTGATGNACGGVGRNKALLQQGPHSETQAINEWVSKNWPNGFIEATVLLILGDFLKDLLNIRLSGLEVEQDRVIASGSF